MYHRSVTDTLERRLREPRRFLQILAGPRQVGKTTAVRQVLERLDVPTHYATADEPTLQSAAWISQQWETARLRADEDRRRGAVLALDEIQKASAWAPAVKRLWGEDTAAGRRLKVVLLDSSPLLMQQGLTESLAGRFEIIAASHWTFAEMRDAFGFDLERYLYFGGYPGAAPLVKQPARWVRYIKDSLIETTVSRDILLMTRVEKPALLRRLFHLACEYSGQVVSYQKMVGQLQEAGNTTTLAHYLELLSGAGMVTGLQKFAGQAVRRRASSPKLQVLNTGLMTAQSGRTLAAARRDTEFWGRLVESAVGAHLVNTARDSDTEVFYWRERNREVDFVLRRGRKVTAIEVKSGRNLERPVGMEAFARAFHPQRTLLVGETGIPIDEFLLQPAGEWVG
jgi:predicted AAA+ superfamily ATPase